MIYCAKLQVSNFILLPPTWVAILVAFCLYIDCVSMQNLESVALMVSEKRCLDMTDRKI